MNPGELKERLIIQSLVQNGNLYTWIGSDNSKLWTKKEVEDKKCVYSSLGQAADLTTRFIIRYNKNITKHNSIIHNGNHYVIASILDIGNKHCYLEVKTAQVTPIMCELRRYSGQLDVLNRPIKEPSTVMTFPAYVTEKHIKYNAEYYANVAEMYILITPKIVQPNLGDLVVINNIKYNIQAAHLMDVYRNEYEIAVNKEV